MQDDDELSPREKQMVRNGAGIMVDRDLLSPSHDIVLVDEPIEGVSEYTPPDIVFRPKMMDVLEDAANIGKAFLEKLLEKQDKNILQTSQIQDYAKLVDALVKLAREQREQDKLLPAEELTEEELQAVAASVVARRKK